MVKSVDTLVNRDFTYSNEIKIKLDSIYTFCNFLPAGNYSLRLR